MNYETLEFALDVAYQSDEYWDAPTKIFMVLDEDDINNIKKAREFMLSCKEDYSNPIFSVNVEVGNMDTDNDDFNSRDVHYVIVYEHGLYYYCQSKYDSRLNLESESFEINFETGELIV